MKNNPKILIGILSIVLVILAACDSAKESSADVDKPSQNNNTTQSTAGHSTDENDLNTIGTENNNDANEQADTTNNEESAATNEQASLKEEYLKKLNDAKKETEYMRENPIDGTTYAMKKVEGDLYDIWDGLLNEIYGVLQKQLSPEEMEQLRIEQREWIDYRDKTAKEASLKYEGGTMEQLEYVAVQNNLTIERCFELVEDYMK